jgi:hypothetical protein
MRSLVKTVVSTRSYTATIRCAWRAFSTTTTAATTATATSAPYHPALTLSITPNSVSESFVQRL